MKKSVLFSLILILPILQIKAQSKSINELQDSLSVISNDVSRIDVLIKISNKYRYKHRADSALFYIEKAVAVSEKLQKQLIIKVSV